ncbi:hypothetical protein EYC80_003419 [Monilinia laxa]|uniref:Uncharacterized protein n=1 Tax=Monilinia laxa TaxID=61186 RepID=A0A5N6KDV8_MONLA|nr:hypothetical protein EYC80_003419 [Monilinia laxa]
MQTNPQIPKYKHPKQNNLGTSNHNLGNLTNEAKNMHGKTMDFACIPTRNSQLLTPSTKVNTKQPIIMKYA